MVAWMSSRRLSRNSAWDTRNILPPMERVTKGDWQGAMRQQISILSHGYAALSSLVLFVEAVAGSLWGRKLHNSFYLSVLCSFIILLTTNLFLCFCFLFNGWQGVANRGASVRVGRDTEKNGKGELSRNLQSFWCWLMRLCELIGWAVAHHCSSTCSATLPTYLLRVSMERPRSLANMVLAHTGLRFRGRMLADTWVLCQSDCLWMGQFMVGHSCLDSSFMTHLVTWHVHPLLLAWNCGLPRLHGPRNQGHPSMVVRH